MVIAPFRSNLGFSTLSIQAYGGICKCANFFFSLAFQREHCASNLVQAHPGDISCGHSESITGLSGVEIPYILKIRILQIISRIYPATGQ